MNQIGLLLLRKLGPYWICQILGWLFYLAAMFALPLIVYPKSWQRVGLVVLSVSIGFATSHLLRLYVRRSQWTHLSLRQLLPRVLLASLLSALVWKLVFTASYVLVKPLANELDAAALLFVRDVIDGSGTMLLWSALYFGYHYFRRHREAELGRWKLEAAVKDAELRALKSQVNPHFLFNALNSIRALIVDEPRKARDAVTHLSNILRYALDSGDSQTVSLEHEMEMVREYLRIAEIRFDERLQSQCQIAPDCLAVQVPPMAIQTLVENGIKHGIARLPGGGCIRISARKAEGCCVVEVQSPRANGRSSDAPGLGLQNTRERLRLLCGPQASLLLRSEGALVTAHMEIPIGEEGHESSAH